MLLLSVYPLMRGIALGFTDARAGLNVDTNFIGFDNFAKLLHNDLFWDSFRIGLIWTVSVTILQFVAALGLALLLNTDLQVPRRGPDAGADPVGDAAGGGRDHVAAAAAPDQRPGQRDPAERCT